MCPASTRLMQQNHSRQAQLSRLNAVPNWWLLRCAAAAWLEQGTLQRVVMVVTNAQTNEVVERWTFSVQTDPPQQDG